MTLGMMFGSGQNSVDEWSTEDDGEEEYDDEDDGDEIDDLLPFGFIREHPPLYNFCHNEIDTSWEPQLKRYFDPIKKPSLDEFLYSNDHPDKSDSEKKSKQARKRAEKRRKQKEKKQKESSNNPQNEDPEKVMNTEEEFNNLDLSNLKPEQKRRYISLSKNNYTQDVYRFISEGNLDALRKSMKLSQLYSDLPEDIRETIINEIRTEINSFHFLHKCITNFQDQTDNNPDIQVMMNNTSNHKKSYKEVLNNLSKKRCNIARFLINLDDPVFDLTAFDGSGLSILHQSIVSKDINFLKLVLGAISEGKSNLNVNSRCKKQGWAPLHYAVDCLNTDALDILLKNNANVNATMATDKRLSPYELAKAKLKSLKSSAAENEKTTLESICDKLKDANDKLKLAKHQEKSSKAPPSSSSKESCTSKPTEDVKESEPIDKKSEKKKKKEKKKKNQLDSLNLDSKLSENVKDSNNPTQNQEANVDKKQNPLVEMSVDSRDEMVDRLLAMGFKESDCLAAISLYGTNVDKAISWLCEPKTAKSKVNVDNVKMDQQPPQPNINAASKTTSTGSAKSNKSKTEEHHKPQLADSSSHVTPKGIVAPASHSKSKEESIKGTKSWAVKNIEDEKTEKTEKTEKIKKNTSKSKSEQTPKKSSPKHSSQQQSQVQPKAVVSKERTQQTNQTTQPQKQILKPSDFPTLTSSSPKVPKQSPEPSPPQKHDQALTKVSNTNTPQSNEMLLKQEKTSSFPSPLSLPLPSPGITSNLDAQSLNSGQTLIQSHPIQPSSSSSANHIMSMNLSLDENQFLHPPSSSVLNSKVSAVDFNENNAGHIKSDLLGSFSLNQIYSSPQFALESSINSLPISLSHDKHQDVINPNSSSSVTDGGLLSYPNIQMPNMPGSWNSIPDIPLGSSSIDSMNNNAFNIDYSSLYELSVGAQPFVPKFQPSNDPIPTFPSLPNSSSSGVSSNEIDNFGINRENMSIPSLDVNINNPQFSASTDISSLLNNSNWSSSLSDNSYLLSSDMMYSNNQNNNSLFSNDNCLPGKEIGNIGNTQSSNEYQSLLPPYLKNDIGNLDSENFEFDASNLINDIDNYILNDIPDLK